MGQIQVDRLATVEHVCGRNRGELTQNCPRMEKFLSAHTRCSMEQRKSAVRLPYWSPRGVSSVWVASELVQTGPVMSLS